MLKPCDQGSSCFYKMKLHWLTSGAGKILGTVIFVFYNNDNDNSRKSQKHFTTKRLYDSQSHKNKQVSLQICVNLGTFKNRPLFRTHPSFLHRTLMSINTAAQLGVRHNALDPTTVQTSQLRVS